MPAGYDASDFVDSDFESSRKAPYASAAMTRTAAPEENRPPTREELDYRVSETQVKLAELKRAQEELERERAGLEEARRRQIEFQTGREEMLQNLTRGLGLLEESEFATRRDAEQMSKAIVDMREALNKVQAINEQTWNKDTVNVEITRALTTIENARMEWNSARLKFPVLAGAKAEEAPPDQKAEHPLDGKQSLTQLCKIGFALTWPIVLVGVAILLILIFRH